MDPINPGTPLTVRVQHPNHEPYVEQMVFVDSQRIRRNVTLVTSGQGSSWAVDATTGKKIMSSGGGSPAPEPAPSPTPPEPGPGDGIESAPTVPQPSAASAPTGQATP
jgi:hypothetical protein